jgi:hypothetical protein
MQFPQLFKGQRRNSILTREIKTKRGNRVFLDKFYLDFYSYILFAIYFLK